ncbi:unnamed protein product [Fraxinus pennsylvanica]|uniref:PB1 domain-containing protein n=1 Tax=Fraxinus pennsylvanica TaxID=56036 RepID=A0AAD1ZNC0_9LAMI|nr:unnamed protein product [Fraxinus pennsylvanica]
MPVVLSFLDYALKLKHWHSRDAIKMETDPGPYVWHELHHSYLPGSVLKDTYDFITTMILLLVILPPWFNSSGLSGLGITNLKEEVTKRLKLEVGTFDIKYLDDDQEWVPITCDADLQECIDISRSSGSNIIRLFVDDIMVNIGSSCDSSGE